METPMSSTVMPTPEQLTALAESGPEGAIVMVNLLRYRERAAYGAERPEAKENISGKTAYQRYGATALRCVIEAGGQITWGGQQALVVIGSGEDEWDEVICVRYPSRQAFLAMTDRPDYRAALYHRDAGLERTALLCCSAGTAA
jgi:uncharacterized protein (DUF1330 family)